MFGDPYSSEERFGPYSVSNDFRGMGIGKIILHLCLSKMEERGLDKAWAQATPNSGAARAVYDKAGFETIGEYITFKKSNTKE